MPNPFHHKEDKWVILAFFMMAILLILMEKI